MLEVDIFYKDKMSAMHDRLTLLPKQQCDKSYIPQTVTMITITICNNNYIQITVTGNRKDNEGRGSTTLLTRQATVRYMPVMVLTILGL